MAPPKNTTAGTGSTAPDDKSDPREPDTTADARTDTPASAERAWQHGDDAARLAGFHTIDGHDLDEGPGAGEPVRMPAINGANSTFAERKAARLKAQTTTVDPADASAK